MKQKLISIMCFWAAVFGLHAQNLHITTPHTSLVYRVVPGKPLSLLYYGDRITDKDLQTLDELEASLPEAYPAYGRSTLEETALSIIHSDGGKVTNLIVDNSPRSKGLGSTQGSIITLRDTYYPITVTLHFLTYPDNDIIETWTEVHNDERNIIQLTDYASAYLPIHKGNVWLRRLYGAWANECQVIDEPLTRGLRVIQNCDGIRNSHTAHAELMLSLDGKPQETCGRIIAAALCYTGDYRLRLSTSDDDYHYLVCGINAEHNTISLKKGESFSAPHLAFTYSSEGMGSVSRQFHRWGRKYQMANGNRLRKVLLNSWEGVYFGINEERMHQMMRDAADMGCELFVMDDGWFGNKYHRNDTQGLGDWVTDSQKLPHGIRGLVNYAANLHCFNGLGSASGGIGDSTSLSFGIWLEPEAINTKSELYEHHPEWTLHPLHGDPLTGRGGTQQMLDMSNPKVQNFVFNLVDTLLTSYPEIDYIKWDANANFLNHEVSTVSYHEGLVKTLQRIRQKYPNVTIQDCASGGGRVNWGYLPYFDEYWTSDNTDALQRIRIQYGVSLFFPAIGMGSHISASPGHQIYRSIPLKYRIDVAMSGRLGLEIQPKDMTDSEKNICRRAIADYKTIRPLVQMGDLYRLASPYDQQGYSSLMYVNDEKTEAVCFWYKLESYKDQHLPLLRMQGLDPETRYRIQELDVVYPDDKYPLEGKKFTGAYLMQTGIQMPLIHIIKNRFERTDYSSRVIRLTKE